MTQPNPYAPPACDSMGDGERRMFVDLDTKALHRVRNASLALLALGLLWALRCGATLVLAAIVGAANQGHHRGQTVLHVAICGLCGLGAHVALARPRWGHGMDLALSVLALFEFPVGLLLGTLGLAALVPHRRLFGDDRYLHADIEREYQHRKLHRIP